MNLCYLCSTLLNSENDSIEHIIPNVLGGYWKSNTLLCAKCNSSTGHLFDSSLTEVADYFTVHHKIKRDRGGAEYYRAIEKGTGRKVKVYSDNSRSYDNEVKIDHTPGNITIKTDTIERAKNELEKFLKNNEQIKNAFISKSFGFKHVISQVEIELRFNFGNPLFLRSAMKMIINFYLSSGGHSKDITSGIEFLKTDFPICAHISPLEISKTYHDNNPLHIIFIRGSQKSKAIYAYVEIFGIIGVVGILNFSYLGDDFEMDYIFDPRTREILTRTYPFKLNISAILEFLHIQNIEHRL